MQKDKGKPPLTPKVGNVGKKRSFVWSHFTTIEKGGGDLGQLVTTGAQLMLVIVS